LSSYYQLSCDFGTAVMISWEKGGVAPIYLCEAHVTEVGRPDESLAGFPAIKYRLPRNLPAEHPKSSTPSEAGPGAQGGLEKKDSALVPVPVPGHASGDAAKVFAHEAVGNTAREDFEAYGTVLQRLEPSTATPNKEAESVGLERLCVSRYGERCSGEATVHCPKCGRWFCDVHAEEKKWHHCALAD
jgi:hypothetical protein